MFDIFIHDQKFANKETQYSFRIMIPTLSSIMQSISFYILIHVFWHYGLNIEKTLEKQQKQDEINKQK